MASPVAPQSLSKILMNHTRSLHQKINDHPFMASLGDATFSLPSYQQYLVNSFCIYNALERNLAHNMRYSEYFKGLNLHQLERADRLSQDMEFCQCSDWKPSILAEQYAAHLDSLSNNDSSLLVAHEWVQYGRTMAGGQILKRHVASRLKHFVATGQLPDSSTHSGIASYEFDTPTPVLRKSWHQRLSALHFTPHQMEKLVEEARVAFERTFESLPGSVPRSAL